jgi:DNA-binding IscR family transcriptional regulator
MQITHQADYATRAILYLAQREKGKHIATGKVAKEQKIPS